MYAYQRSHAIWIYLNTFLPWIITNHLVWVYFIHISFCWVEHQWGNVWLNVICVFQSEHITMCSPSQYISSSSQHLSAISIICFFIFLLIIVVHMRSLDGFNSHLPTKDISYLILGIPNIWSILTIICIMKSFLFLYWIAYFFHFN
jgi:hypothetical protein